MAKKARISSFFQQNWADDGALHKAMGEYIKHSQPIHLNTEMKDMNTSDWKFLARRKPHKKKLHISNKVSLLPTMEDLFSEKILPPDAYLFIKAKDIDDYFQKYLPEIESKEKVRSIKFHSKDDDITFEESKVEFGINNDENINVKCIDELENNYDQYKMKLSLKTVKKGSAQQINKPVVSNPYRNFLLRLEKEKSSKLIQEKNDIIAKEQSEKKLYEIAKKFSAWTSDMRHERKSEEDDHKKFLPIVEPSFILSKFHETAPHREEIIVVDVKELHPVPEELYNLASKDQLLHSSLRKQFNVKYNFVF